MEHWITEKPKVSFLSRARRLEADRRVHFGIWARFQKQNRLTPSLLTPQSEFRKEWLFLKHGDIKFPESVIFDSDYQYLIDVGKRRAMHTEHPNPYTSHPIRLIDVESELQFGPPQFYFRRDHETQYISYLIYIESDTNHLIKVELDIDKIGKLISEEAYKGLQDLIDIIPKWEG